MSASSEVGADRSRLDGFELEIFKLVREHATAQQWKEWLRAPLEHAAAGGNGDLFTRLVDAGADCSAGWRGCHGRTLLGAAAYGKQQRAALALLKAGAKTDVNVKFGAQQESALHVAAARGAETVSRVLMTAGADPNLLDKDLRSPLHVTAEAGHDGVVGMLLLKDVDPNRKTGNTQETPLHLAAKNNHASCVSELLLAGAEKNALNIFGGTPLYLAAGNNQLEAVEELLAAGASHAIRVAWKSLPLNVAASNGYVDVLKALLRHGSSIEARDAAGWTALHHAAWVEVDNSDAIRALLEAGADIGAKNNEGNTPLHHACQRLHSSPATIRALLAGGADINVRCTQAGWTPLHGACWGTSASGVRTLLREGADEKLTNNEGETAEELLGGYEDEDEDVEQQRQANIPLIRQMLATAPADRIWRRRGWLVLCRSYPARVQLANASNTSSSGSSAGASSSTKMARVSCEGSGGRGDGTTGDTAGLARLVGRVVELDSEDVFRLVVEFL